MGKGRNKGGGGKGGKKGYVHNHTYNPRAHESVDRKLEMLKGIEVRTCGWRETAWGDV